MKLNVRISIILLLLILPIASCRPICEPITPTQTPTPLILSPLYQAVSYRDLIEENWVVYADQPATVPFDEFIRIVEANIQQSEEPEDVFATLYAIASQHAFIQGQPLESEYFLVAAHLSCWWHPPSSPSPSAEWINIRPELISRAFQSGLSRLNIARRVDSSIYAMSPYDALELLKHVDAVLFLHLAPWDY